MGLQFITSNGRASDQVGPIVEQNYGYSVITTSGETRSLLGFRGMCGNAIDAIEVWDFQSCVELSAANCDA